RRHRHLAVGLALRVADHRSQGVSQRDAVVHKHCQTAGGSEGLQSAQGRRRDSNTSVITASGGRRGRPTILSSHCCAPRWLALCARAERGSTARMRQRQPAATLRWLVSVCAAALVLTSTQAGAAPGTIDRPAAIYVGGGAGGRAVVFSPPRPRPPRRRHPLHTHGRRAAWCFTHGSWAATSAATAPANRW